MNETLLLGPIIGGLVPREANLWGKAKSVDVTSTGEDVFLHAWVGTKANLSDAKLAGKSHPLTEVSDYSGVVPLKNLKPRTTYYYALTLDKQPPQQAGGHFTTFPKEGEPVSFSFAFGSCYLPKGADSGRAFRKVNEYCANQQVEANEPRFILMIGDQIYADIYPENGLNKPATTRQEYRDVYTHTWANQDHRKLLADLPAYMTLDDHEVDDDWAWWDKEHTRAYNSILVRCLRFLGGRPLDERIIKPERVQAALRACWEHQYMHSRGFLQLFDLNDAQDYILEGNEPGSLAYKFNYGATAFFVMDTRTHRIRDLHNIHMLGNKQKQLVRDWLLKVKDTHPVKFLVTSSAFLFELWVDIARDRWTGYAPERNELLAFIAENNIQGVHFLTGDLHSAHALGVKLKSANGQPLPIWEFCASPFQQRGNFLSWTYRKIRTPQIIPGSHDLRFKIPHNNFGIVKVDYTGQTGKVQYDLHYEDKDGTWKVAPPVIC